MIGKIVLSCAITLAILITGCSNHTVVPDEPVRPVINLDQTKIDYVAGSSCWFGTKEVGTCSDPLHPDTFYKTIKDQATVAKPWGKIKIKFPIKPDALYLNITNTNEESVEIGKAEQYSYALPASPGY